MKTKCEQAKRSTIICPFRNVLCLGSRCNWWNDKGMYSSYAEYDGELHDCCWLMLEEVYLRQREERTTDLEDIRREAREIGLFGRQPLRPSYTL